MEGRDSLFIAEVKLVPWEVVEGKYTRGPNSRL